MGDGFSKWCSDNPILCALIVIIIIVLVYHFFFRKERMSGFTLDQIAMNASDPTIVKYLGRERDPLGMSMIDYYLEHDRNANNVVAPRYNDDMAFGNTTSYLAMPQWYRPAPGYKPRPLAMLVNQAGNVSTADEGFTGNVNSKAPTSANAGINEVIATLKETEHMNQRNKSGRERFFV
jgi:hypothetical protein